MARADKKYTVTGVVLDENSNSPLAEYTVKAFDADHLSKDDFLGECVSDEEGRFTVRFQESDFIKNIIESLIDRGLNLILQVYAPNGELLLTTSTRSSTKLFEDYRILIPTPPLPSVKIKKLLQTAGIANTSEAEKKFAQVGLTDSCDFLSKLKDLKAKDIGLDQKAFNNTIWTAKLHAITGSLPLTERLNKFRDIANLTDLSAVPLKRLENNLGKLNDQDKSDLQKLYAKAKFIRHRVLDHAAQRQRAKSKDGSWYSGYDISGKPKPSDDKKKCHDCEPCGENQNIFSPRTYLFDLLDLIYFQWGLTSSVLEKVFYQEIDNLKCEEGNAPVLQVELAVEVMEKYFKGLGIPLPLSDDPLMAKILQGWLDLLEVEPDTLSDLAAGHTIEEDNLSALQKLAVRIMAMPVDLNNMRGIKDLLIVGETPDADIAKLSSSYKLGGDMFAEQLSATYGRVLVSYRDEALIKQSPEHRAQTLQEKLFIDTQARPCSITSRITQLIISIQSFILSARTGDIVDVERDDLSEVTISFAELSAYLLEETSWQWLKDFQAWASAMYTLLYPENVLMPPIFDEGYSQAFEKAQLALSKMGSIDHKATCLAFLDYLFEWSIPMPLVDIREQEANQDEAEETDENDEGTSQPMPLRGSMERKLAKACAKLKARAKVRIRRRTSLNDFIEFVHSNVWDPDWWLENFSELFEFCGWWVTGSDTFYPPGSSDPDCFRWKDISAKSKQEIFLQFPLLAGWALNRSGEFAAAHDWYRRLYDPFRPRTERHVFPFSQYFNETTIRTDHWWEDVLDVSIIAERRQGVYLRYVILTMVKNLLDWADHEYALSRPETIDRARQLYEQARRILSAPDLADRCGQALRDLELDIVTHFDVHPYRPDIAVAVGSLREIRNSDILSVVMEDIYGLLPEVRTSGNIDPLKNRIQQALTDDRAARNDMTLAQQLAKARAALAAYEDDLLFSSGDGSPKPKEKEGSSTGTVLPFYTLFALSGSSKVHKGIMSNDPVIVTTSTTFCVPPNPLLNVLNLYIEVNLEKLRRCLSIAGEPLPAGSRLDPVSTVLSEIAGESTLAPGAADYLPWVQPRYRYSYIVEKARQYAELAQRLGTSLLLAFEKREEEKFRQIQAQQALELAESSVTLKNLAVKEAETGKLVAEAQEERATVQHDFWQERINEGMMSSTEENAILMMKISGVLSAVAGVAHGYGAIMAALGFTAVGSVGGTLIGPEGTPVGGAAGLSLGSAVALALPGTGAALSSFGQAFGTFGNINLTFASFERRWEDWNLQKDLSNWDVTIAGHQVTQMQDRINIADQEQKIAVLQQGHSRETLEFHKNKFSNDKLYIWMIDVLRQNYRSVMQLGAATASLAQRSLEFERQEKINIVVGDYWSLPAADASTSGLSDEQRESGLLCAERLLADLTRLDAYKLATERRRLQLSKTISMAQMIPCELVKLRTNGMVTFNTLMDYFDLDFPGHYLRLIKSVRVSILCLASAIDGIHAMLHNGGESSVVVRDAVGNFKKQRSLRAFPESIALDSTLNENGLFVLDYNDPMYLPFEGLGVETQWTLELPRATNSFNFDTIVDVLLTLEYTAYHDMQYANTVKDRFKGVITTRDIMLDLHTQYADEWYHFKNPKPIDTDQNRMITVNLESTRLPRNFKNEGSPIQVHHFTLLVVGDFSDMDNDETVFQAVKISKDGITFVGNATPLTGEQSFATRNVAEGRRYVVFSTRMAGDKPDNDRGIASSVLPAGEWKINLSDPKVVELVDDIVLVVTIKGKLNWV